jgi:hypothetical protein
MNTTPTNTQMELGFASARRPSPETRRQRRLQRAAWWFNQMRQAVDRALDLQPRSFTHTSHFAPPTQTWFPGTHREVRV